MSIMNMSNFIFNDHSNDERIPYGFKRWDLYEKYESPYYKRCKYGTKEKQDIMWNDILSRNPRWYIVRYTTNQKKIRYMLLAVVYNEILKTDFTYIFTYCQSSKRGYKVTATKHGPSFYEDDSGSKRATIVFDDSHPVYWGGERSGGKLNPLTIYDVEFINELDMEVLYKILHP